MIIVMGSIVAILLCRRRKCKQLNSQNGSGQNIEIESNAPGKAPGAVHMENLGSISMSNVHGDAEGHGEQVEGQQHGNATTTADAP